MKDKCVSCHTETEYDKNLHIHNRKHYIEGAGQLCKLCYETIYNKDISLLVDDKLISKEG